MTYPCSMFLKIQILGLTIFGLQPLFRVNGLWVQESSKTPNQFCSPSGMSWELRNGTFYLDGCCEGYRQIFFRSGVYLDCEPICDPDCINGNCTAPGSCTCFRGYVHETNSSCVPFCDPPCLDGICTLPGICECKEGYAMLGGSLCFPECSDCAEGKCTEPEVCSCYPGYEGPSCDHPACESSCALADCLSHNHCECLKEHEKVEENLCFPMHGDCGYCTDDVCPIAERTTINLSMTNSSAYAFMRLELKTSCSELLDNHSPNCDLESQNNTDCTGLSIECSPVMNTKDIFKFICIWTGMVISTNNSFETYTDLFNEGIIIIFYEGQIFNETESVESNVSATVLLPYSLMRKEETCELCSLPTNHGLDETNSLKLQFLPCHNELKDSLSSLKDDSFTFVIMAAVFLATLTAFGGIAYRIYRGRLHVYRVSSRNGKTENLQIMEL